MFYKLTLLKRLVVLKYLCIWLGLKSIFFRFFFWVICLKMIYSSSTRHCLSQILAQSALFTHTLNNTCSGLRVSVSVCVCVCVKALSKLYENKSISYLAQSPLLHCELSPQNVYKAAVYIHTHAHTQIHMYLLMYALDYRRNDL